MEMLIAVVGATGTGKSELALQIGERLMALGAAAEIVNADAMQLYRGMDIGTAKLSIAERRGIPHHQLDTLDVTDEANVAAYQSAARADIAAILERGAVPILVGGSGLYVSSVIHHYTFPGTDAAVRAQLESELETLGIAALHDRLRGVDPAAADAIGPFNARRIIRALEVISITGEAFGAGLPDETKDFMPTFVVGLQAPRAELVQRLDARVTGMWEAGLLAEVEGLLQRGLAGGITASRAIGYAQATAQLSGEVTEAEAIADTQAITRRYARRQVGWFRRYPKVLWLEHDAPELARTVVTHPALASMAV